MATQSSWEHQSILEVLTFTFHPRTTISPLSIGKLLTNKIWWFWHSKNLGLSLVLTENEGFVLKISLDNSSVLSQHRVCKGQSVTKPLCFGSQNSRMRKNGEGVPLFLFFNINTTVSSFPNMRTLPKRKMRKPNRQWYCQVSLLCHFHFSRSSRGKVKLCF